MRVYQAFHTGLPSLVSGVVASGAAWRIVGEAAGESWMVAEGVGSGTVVAVSDPAGPVDVTVTYTLEAPTVEVASFRRSLRDPFADTILTSVDGRASIEVLWEGDAAAVLDPRSAFASPLASRWPWQTRQLAPAAPTYGLDCRVDTVDVEVARRVFESGRVWVTHSHDRCGDGVCPLPRAMLAGIAGTVAEGTWPEGRTFAATLQQLEPEASGVPVVTWGDARRAGVVWHPNTTFASIRSIIAGE